MAKTSKKAKKPVTKKSRKQAKDDRIFNYVLIGLGVLLVLGLVLSLMTRGGGNAGTASTGSGDHAGTIQTELTGGSLGKKLTSSGFSNPTYDQSKSQEFMVISDQSFLRLSEAEQKKIMNEIGDEWAKLLEKHFGDSKLAYIMFHSDAEHMAATWTPQSGAQFYSGGGR